MNGGDSVKAFGWRVYGAGAMAIGLACLAFREFDPGQPVPEGFPGRAVLAFAAGALMVAAAAAIEWRRTAMWGAGALSAYYAVVVVILMNGRLLLSHFGEYSTYENIAEQLAIAAGGLIVFAAFARTDGKIDAALAARLARLGRLAFGVCALVWGGAHFVYMNLTAPLVPKWLPPSQVFWGYATGVCLLAAGAAILTGVKARLAAILLTAMIGCFALLIHEPMLLADHASHFNWTESAENLAILGAAWVVADSLAPGRSVASENAIDGPVG
jgi:uncharacterized membrane protein YphA (DoxX/SURF4 family)